MSCPMSYLFGDSEKVKATLNKYSRYVKGLEGMLLFRNIPQYAVLLAAVNLGFFFIGYLHLSFLAVAALAALLYTVGKLVMDKLGDKIIDFFFPETFEEGKEGESNRVRSADELAAIIDEFAPKQCPIKKAAPIKRIIIFATLFVVFSITGTFWLNFTIVNLVLIVPGVLLHPAVYPHVIDLKNKVFPPKEKTE